MIRSGASRVFFLSVILRQNSANTEHCPSVDEEGKALTRELLGAEIDVFVNPKSNVRACSENFEVGPQDDGSTSPIFPETANLRIRSPTLSDHSRRQGEGSVFPQSIVGIGQETIQQLLSSLYGRSSSASQTISGSQSPTTGDDSSLPSLTLVSIGSTGGGAKISSGATGAGASPSPTRGPLQKSNKSGARTAAIACSTVSVGLLVAFVVIILWLRRRRQRIDHHRLPEHFADAREHLAQGILRMKPGSTDPGGVTPENRPIPHGHGDPEEDSPHNGTLSARMRRMEAQMAALATIVLPESSLPPPPSYTS
ncbi:hypothetical protein MVEN_00682000 [Mycena venus]|uniref:Mid2 domain-containing protein n=1 Tax=Mycena venus TaxID=2733690 RepID=A0A8H6YEC5_9AGAR|nr:hypothetical protein MVEN_00682000 [Mycena venus]